VSAWIESLPSPISGTIVVGTFVVLALVLTFATDRLTPRLVRREHNDLTGFILAVVGVIYAVLLAFVTIGVWERYEQAAARTFDETGMLTVAYRDADVFPQSAELRSTIRAYAEAVVDDEWPKMRDGEASQRADALMERVDRIVRTLPARSPSQQNVHAQMLSAINQAQNDRDARLSEDAGGVNELLWIVLVAGAVITIAFTFLFGFRNIAMHLLSTGGLALLIGLVLFVAIAMNYPYRGGITVPAEAFHSALHEFSSLSR
jgi:heme/copper-type cytochrome/quinol oxidase subunit 2